MALLRAWRQCQEVPDFLHARANVSLERVEKPAGAVCEITCLERKFLQLRAGCYPNLGCQQLSHLFFFFQSSLVALRRVKEACFQIPASVCPFSLHPLTGEASRAETLT